MSLKLSGRSAVFYGAAITIAFAMLYGANLYFSVNANINDPIVPAAWPLAKDALLVTVATMFAFRHRLEALAALRQPAVVALGILVVAVTVISVIKFGVSRDIASLVKNAVLYGFGGAVIGFMLATRLGAEQLRQCLVVALYIALVVSLLLLFHPIQSLDGRAYGTYGNPTSLGYSVVVILGLALWRGSLIECVSAGLAASITYLFTGSMSVMLAASIVIGGCFMVQLVFHRRMGGAVAAGLAFGIVILAACIATLMGSRAFIGAVRIVDFALSPETLLTTDSVRIRAADLQSSSGKAGLFLGSVTGEYHRFDSYLLSLWANFGVLPVLAYVAVLASIVATYWRANDRFSQTPMLITVLVLFLINPLLQHQIEVFPTNLLFSLVLGLSVFSFSGGTGSRHWSAHQRS